MLLLVLLLLDDSSEYEATVDESSSFPVLLLFARFDPFCLGKPIQATPPDEFPISIAPRSKAGPVNELRETLPKFWRKTFATRVSGIFLLPVCSLSLVRTRTRKSALFAVFISSSENTGVGAAWIMAEFFLKRGEKGARRLVVSDGLGALKSCCERRGVVVGETAAQASRGGGTDNVVLVGDFA